MHYLSSKDGKSLKKTDTKDYQEKSLKEKISLLFNDLLSSIIFAQQIPR